MLAASYVQYERGRRLTDVQDVPAMCKLDTSHADSHQDLFILVCIYIYVYHKMVLCLPLACFVSISHVIACIVPSVLGRICST